MGHMTWHVVEAMPLAKFQGEHGEVGIWFQFPAWIGLLEEASLSFRSSLWHEEAGTVYLDSPPKLEHPLVLRLHKVAGWGYRTSLWLIWLSSLRLYFVYMELYSYHKQNIVDENIEKQLYSHKRGFELCMVSDFTYICCLLFVHIIEHYWLSHNETKLVYQLNMIV